MGFIQYTYTYCRVYRVLFLNSILEYTSKIYLVGILSAYISILSDLESEDKNKKVNKGRTKNTYTNNPNFLKLYSFAQLACCTKSPPAASFNEFFSKTYLYFEFLITVKNKDNILTIL